jgi:hypothetical protein
MPVRAGDVIERAQIVLNDNDPAYVRWSKAELFAWLNDAASEVVIRRPSAGAVYGNVALEAGILQKIPADGIELLDVTRNVGGKPVRRTDRQLLDDQRPDWMTSKAGATKHYTFDERTRTTFYVYPPAVAGAQVEVLYSAPPPLVAEEDDMLQMDRAYIGPLVSYILYRALAKDSEFANGQIAAAHYQAFEAAFGAFNSVASAVTPNLASV